MQAVKEFTQSKTKEIKFIEYTARERWTGQQRRACLQRGGDEGSQLEGGQSEGMWGCMEFSFFLGDLRNCAWL